MNWVLQHVDRSYLQALSRSLERNPNQGDANASVY